MTIPRKPRHRRGMYAIVPHILSTLDPLRVHVELVRHLEADVLVLEDLAAARLAAGVVLHGRLVVLLVLRNITIISTT